MNKWQYLRDEVENETEMDQKLLHWGNLGWELISVCYIAYDSSNALTGEAKVPRPWKLFLKQPAMKS